MKASFLYFTINKDNKIILLLSFVMLLSACKQTDTAFKNNYYALDFSKLVFETSEVTFGDSSDVVIPNLPQNAFTISPVQGSKKFIWKANFPLYFKLHGKTLNRIENNNIRALLVNQTSIPIEIFNSEVEKLKNSKAKRITNLEFSDIFNDYDQNYIPLARLLKNINGNLPFENIQSLYSTKEACFILLDTIIKIVPNEGLLQGYKFSDTAEYSGNNKLEFFSLIPYSNYPTDNTKKHIRNSDTCFHVKVQPFFTNYGASSFFISSTSEKIVIAFDNPFRFCYSNQLLENKLAANGNLPINIVQDYQATSFSNDVIIPNFSYSKQQSFGQIESIKKSPLILSTLSFHSIPNLIRFICPLIVAFSIIFLSYFYSPVSKYKIKKLYLINESGQERKSWRNHFLILFSVLFLFLIYRIFIAFQLSYTGPYFTYFLPMQTLIAPLMLILVNWCWTSFALLKSITPEANRTSQLSKMQMYNNLFAIILVLLSVFLSFLFSDEVSNLYNLHRVTGESILDSKSTFSSLNIFILIYGLIGSLFFLQLLTLFKPVKKLTKFISDFFISRVNSISSKWKRKRVWLSIILTIAILFVTSFFISNGYSVLLLVALLVNQYLAFTTPLSEKYTKWEYRKYRHLLPFCITAGIMFFAAFKGDFGFAINLSLVFLLVPVCLLFKEEGTHTPEQNKTARLTILKSFSLYLILWLGVVFIWIKIGADFTGKPDELRDRTKSRLTALYDFTKMQEFGMKGSESITQFFAVLSKYSAPYNTESNSNSFHPAICGFSDPVIINDLSFPCAGISPWGKYYPFHILFLLGVLLPILVFITFKSSFYIRTDFDKTKDKHGRLINERNHLTAFGIIRIICVSYLVGSILWLVLSYYGIVPFTGRLVFGLGQDSVAEVLETVILYFGMGIVYNYRLTKKTV